MLICVFRLIGARGSDFLIDRGSQAGEFLEYGHEIAPRLEAESFADGLDSLPAILLPIVKTAARLLHAIFLEESAEIEAKAGIDRLTHLSGGSVGNAGKGIEREISIIDLGGRFHYAAQALGKSCLFHPGLYPPILLLLPLLKPEE